MTFGNGFLVIFYGLFALGACALVALMVGFARSTLKGRGSGRTRLAYALAFWGVFHGFGAAFLTAIGYGGGSSALPSLILAAVFLALAVLATAALLARAPRPGGWVRALAWVTCANVILSLAVQEPHFASSTREHELEQLRAYFGIPDPGRVARAGCVWRPAEAMLRGPRRNFRDNEAIVEEPLRKISEIATMTDGMRVETRIQGCDSLYEGFRFFLSQKPEHPEDAALRMAQGLKLVAATAGPVPWAEQMSRDLEAMTPDEKKQRIGFEPVRIGHTASLTVDLNFGGEYGSAAILSLVYREAPP